MASALPSFLFSCCYAPIVHLPFRLRSSPISFPASFSSYNPIQSDLPFQIPQKSSSNYTSQLNRIPAHQTEHLQAYDAFILRYAGAVKGVFLSLSSSLHSSVVLIPSSFPLKHAHSVILDSETSQANSSPACSTGHTVFSRLQPQLDLAAIAIASTLVHHGILPVSSGCIYALYYLTRVDKVSWRCVQSVFSILFLSFRFSSPFVIRPAVHSFNETYRSYPFVASSPPPLQ